MPTNLARSAAIAALRERSATLVGSAAIAADDGNPATVAPAQRSSPGAVGNVINHTKRLNPAAAAVSSADVFESEQRLRALQLDLLKLKVALQSKYTEMKRLAGGSL